MIDRRNALAGLTGVSIGGVSMGAAPQAAAASLPGPQLLTEGKIDTEILSFLDPVEEFKAHFRMERDLAEVQGETVAWYYWIAYVVPENSAPQPLVRFEGVEYSYYRKVAENTYRIHAHNVSYPRSLDTNAYIDTIINPITSQRVTVDPTILLNDPGTVHSPKGFRNMNGDGSYVQPFRKFRRENDIVKFESVRTAPPNWPVTHMESTIQWCDYERFKDPSVTSLPSRSNGVYVFPYPKWFEMGERGGNMLGFIDAQKIGGIADLPDDFRARIKEEYPELLKARWGEFDRKAPFEY